MRALLALVLLVAGAAQAQNTGSRSGMSTTSPIANMKAYEELRAFGRCVARTQRTAALRVIAANPGSAEESDMLRKYIVGERYTCMLGGDKMAMPNLLARGAIAEGLLLEGGVPAEYRLTAPAVGEARDLHGVARCYVVNHRTEVDGVLATRPGSAEELKAVQALWNDFRACMPGFNVRLNTPWIRSLLAEAALRLPPVTAGQGG